MFIVLHINVFLYILDGTSLNSYEDGKWTY